MSHLSHSQYTQMLRCGKAYELNRIQQAPRTPSVWLVGGVALHDTFDSINKAFYFGTLDALDLRAEWDRCWNTALDNAKESSSVHPSQWRRAGRVSKEKPEREDLDWWYRDGYRQCADYMRWLPASGMKIFAINDTPFSEAEVSANFGEVLVKGFLDCVYITPDGEVLLVDFKSGTRKPSSVLQLAQYALALEKTIGVRPSVGAFFMTRATELTDPADLTRYTDAYFTKQFELTAKMISEGIFLANVGDGCRTCDVSSSCFANGGVDAWKFDPDSPHYQVNAT